MKIEYVLPFLTFLEEKTIIIKLILLNEIL